MMLPTKTFLDFNLVSTYSVLNLEDVFSCSAFEKLYVTSPCHTEVLLPL